MKALLLLAAMTSVDADTAAFRDHCEAAWPKSSGYSLNEVQYKNDPVKQEAWHQQWVRQCIAHMAGKQCNYNPQYGQVVCQ